MKVIFDLDGTLALNDHRAHFVERPVGEKDWRSFFAACDKDSLNQPVAEVLMALFHTGHDVEIWSGRSAEVKDKTTAWLAKNGLSMVPVKMRPEGDHTPDHDLKLSWLRECSQPPALVFDDRATVVSMWRANGVACAQVAEGRF